MNSIILTGATGFLGSHFLLRALRGGQLRVICMGRGKSPEDLRNRTLKALREAAISYRSPVDPLPLLANCEWVCCDLSEQDLGLDTQTIDALAAHAPVAIWHFAASLEYSSANKAHIDAVNVDGTRRLTDLARLVGVERFLYISTAYVNGALAGDIGPTINETGQFNNHYERSKHGAEAVVIASGLDYTILRPSIVIGNSETYLTGGATTGLYLFLRQLKPLSKIADEQGGEIRIKGARAAQINLIPVDEFITDCFSVAELPRDHGRIFNCTADRVCGLYDLQSCLPHMGVDNVKLVEHIEDMTSVEAVVERRANFVSSYMNNAKLRFVRNAPGSAGVSLDDLNQYVANGSSARTTNIFAAVDYMPTATGSPLRYHNTTGSHEQAVILINAYGVPLDFWEPIVETLAPCYDVYAPEFTASGARAVTSEFNADVDDIVALAHDIGKPVHLVSWCSGAMLAAVAATRVESLVSSTFIGGGFILDERVTPLREVATTANRLYERVAENEATGRTLFNFLFRNMRTNMRANAGSPEKDVDFIMSTVNPAYLEWISTIFCDFPTFRSYAIKQVHLWRSPIDAYLPHMRGRKLFMIGQDDATADPRVTVEVAQRVQNADCWLVDDADHYMLHSDSRVTTRLEQFLAVARHDMDSLHVAKLV